MAASETAVEKGFFAAHDVELRMGPAKRIEPKTRTVVLENGTEIVGDALLIATGSRAVVPPFVGGDLKGIHTLRSLADAVALSADAGGNWYAAVGHYHSLPPGLAEAYRERVAAVAQGREPPPNAWQPLYLRAIRQGSLRLALAGGGTLVVKMRQPTARGHRRMDACRAAAVLAPLLSRPPRGGCAPRVATSER